MKSLRRYAKTALAVLCWVLIWQGIAMLVGLEVLVPSPLDTAAYLLQHVGDGAFWLTIAASMGRIVLGYLLALGCGTLLAVGCARVPLLHTLLQPLLTVVRTTPVASFIILVLVWMRRASIPVFISFLIVLPLVWANLYEGLHRVDPDLLEMTHVYRFTRRARIRTLYLPTLQPYFRAAAVTGLGMAWKAGVAAEVLCSPAFSIGGELYNAKVYLETTQLFAWTVVVIVLSFCIEQGLAALLHRLGERMAR